MSCWCLGQVVDLKISPSRHLITTAMEDGFRAATVNLTRIHSRNDLESYARLQSRVPPYGGELPIDYNTSTLSLPRSFWASSPNPYASEPIIAVTSGSGILRVNWREGSWEGSQEELLEKLEEVTAVDWLNQNTVLAGARNGKTVLWDTRSKGKDAHSNPIWHPSRVCHLRALDHNRILIAGTEDKVCLNPIPSYCAILAAIRPI